jgi:hypothetical protein
MRVNFVYKLLVTHLLVVFATFTWSQRATSEKSSHSEANGTVASKNQARPSHGTVNVFLANKNGLVVVTDSLLSNDQGPVGVGQKLFQVDDHTICTIAGWYSDSGPVIRPDVASDPSYPARLMVPDIIRAFVSNGKLGQVSIERKMEMLSKLFRFSLLAVANVDEFAGVKPNASKSEITVAGYNNGVIEIHQADLLPIIQDGKIKDYYIVNGVTISVNEKIGFVSVVRGISSTAQSLLNCSDLSMGIDPIIGSFRSSVANDRWRSLSIQDMEIIASEVALKTAKTFPGKVGGAQQIAALSNGRVSEFVQPIPATVRIPMTLFSVIDGAEMSGAGGLFYVGSPQVAIMQGGKFSGGSSSPVDNIFLFRSAFNHCELTYGGSPRTIFDKSNTVVDSTLTLLPGADPNSNFVKQIRADFPDLNVIDQTGTLQK